MRAGAHIYIYIQSGHGTKTGFCEISMSQTEKQPENRKQRTANKEPRTKNREQRTAINARGRADIFKAGMELKPASLKYRCRKQRTANREPQTKNREQRTAINARGRAYIYIYSKRAWN